MQTLHINSQNRNSFLDSLQPGVAALGFFDGVHLGHQKVIKTAVEIARRRNAQSIVITFTPHPKEVLGNENVHYLTSLETKKDIFKSLGVDALYLVEFTKEISTLHPQKFTKDFLVDFKVKHVVAGFDFKYGYRGKGNMETIVEDGLGSYGATVIDQVLFQNEKISSTRIRLALQQGNVKIMPHLLGDYYRTNGLIRASSNGKNNYEIKIFDRCLLPKPGIYEVEAQIEGKTFRTLLSHTEKDVSILVDIGFILTGSKLIKLKWINSISLSLNEPQLQLL